VHGQGQLPLVIGASSTLGFGFRLGKRGEQHSRQDRDNGYHDQELDQGEGAGTFPPSKNRFVSAGDKSAIVLAQGFHDLILHQTSSLRKCAFCGTSRKNQAKSTTYSASFGFFLTWRKLSSTA
jgi:hypothetical protein